MAVEIKDCLFAGILVAGGSLLNSDDEVQSFGRDYDADIILTAPVDPQAKRQLRMDRHRIVIDVAPEGSSIKQEFPSDDLSLLADVAAGAIRNTKSIGEIGAHGYNVALVYDQSAQAQSRSYIADRVLKDFPTPAGLVVVGGSSDFSCHDDAGRLWNVSIEPRFNRDDTSKVFLSLNLHLLGPPELENISSLLHLAVTTARDFVQKLDGEEAQS